MQQILQRGHQLVDVDRLEVERLLPGEGQQPLGQRGCALGGSHGGADVALQLQRLVALMAALHQVEAADDAGQQVVEVVGNAAGQLADRFHLLRLAQGFFGAAALGDLGGHPRFKRLVELAQAVLADAQGIFDMPAGADVGAGAGDIGERSAGIAKGLGLAGQPALRVGTQQAKLRGVVVAPGVVVEGQPYIGAVFGMNLLDEGIDAGHLQPERQMEDLLQPAVQAEAAITEKPGEGADAGSEQRSAKTLLEVAETVAVLPLDLLGHVFDLVDDVEHLTPLIEHRNIQRPPVAQLETAAQRCGPGDVVAGDRHAIRRAAAQHTLKRVAQYTGAELGWIVRILAEHVEYRSAHAFFPARVGGAQLRVACSEDGEILIRREDQMQVGDGFEYRLIVERLRHRTSGTLE